MVDAAEREGAVLCGERQLEDKQVEEKHVQVLRQWLLQECEWPFTPPLPHY